MNITWNCVSCNRELKPAPTDIGHTDCGEHGKICFDCLDRLCYVVRAVRAQENKEAELPASDNTPQPEILQEVADKLEELKWDFEAGDELTEHHVQLFRMALSGCIAKLSGDA